MPQPTQLFAVQKGARASRAGGCWPRTGRSCRWSDRSTARGRLAGGRARGPAVRAAAGHAETPHRIARTGRPPRTRRSVVHAERLARPGRPPPALQPTAASGGALAAVAVSALRAQRHRRRWGSAAAVGPAAPARAGVRHRPRTAGTRPARPDRTCSPSGQCSAFSQYPGRNLSLAGQEPDHAPEPERNQGARTARRHLKTCPLTVTPRPPTPTTAPSAPRPAASTPPAHARGPQHQQRDAGSTVCRVRVQTRSPVGLLAQLVGWPLINSRTAPPTRATAPPTTRPVLKRAPDRRLARGSSARRAGLHLGAGGRDAAPAQGRVGGGRRRSEALAQLVAGHPGGALDVLERLRRRADRAASLLPVFDPPAGPVAHLQRQRAGELLAVVAHLEGQKVDAGGRRRPRARTPRWCRCGSPGSRRVSTARARSPGRASAPA